VDVKSRGYVMAIYYPPIFINKYLQEKLAVKGFGAVPMFPTYPSDFNIANNFVLDITDGTQELKRYAFQGQAAVYDRMFKMRRTAFPHIKCEQLLYYFYALTENAVVNLIEMTQTLNDLLDYGDESAQDLNSWIATKVNGTEVMDGKTYKTVTFDGKKFLLPYFHDIKVYQLEETRDIVNFGTSRTYSANKLIIDYDWHKSESIV
jgi:hypothetical protein